mgnify:CR=1 FL=1
MAPWIVLMIVFKWNPIQWFGWVLAAASFVYMLNTLVFGLNYFAGPLAEDIRLEVTNYNVEELTEAAEYYRDKAMELATQVSRDANGNVDFLDFGTQVEVEKLRNIKEQIKVLSRYLLFLFFVPANRKVDDKTKEASDSRAKLYLLKMTLLCYPIQDYADT